MEAKHPLEVNMQKGYSPLVKELSGIINLKKEFDLKEEYANYLVEKYR